MVKIKTSQLTGAALDWAVARAEGYAWRLERGCYGSGYHVVIEEPAPSVKRFSVFRPSSDWGQGGRLVESHKIWLSAPINCRVEWRASVDDSCGSIGGGNALEAACKAVVESLLGPEIEIPEELVEQINATT